MGSLLPVASPGVLAVRAARIPASGPVRQPLTPLYRTRNARIKQNRSAGRLRFSRGPVALTSFLLESGASTISRGCKRGGCRR